VYDKNKFMPFAHPHNTYFVYLTGGVLMFSIFSWFWLNIVQIIYRVNKSSNEKWLVFSSSSSVVMIVLGIGWVNTTLAHEHALITMFVLGLLISMDREGSCKVTK